LNRVPADRISSQLIKRFPGKDRRKLLPQLVNDMLHVSSADRVIDWQSHVHGDTSNGRFPDRLFWQFGAKLFFSQISRAASAVFQIILIDPGF
jgi:hypothetical protein